jgi:hypothetical protein
MAYAIGPATVRLTANVESAQEKRVRNDGPDQCFIATDPQLAPAAADSFSLAPSAEETVWVAEGEALYAICAAGSSASLEVI